MDAVNALMYSVLADRAPGPVATPDDKARALEIQLMREQEGVTTASATPSAHEIRQAIVEQLWDPEYYKNLYDNPTTVGQKEIYLKAYNLMMLYDLIDRQEKISNVYAIETSNLLNSVDASRSAASVTSPVTQGP
jgi:hypothetical protein